eukprot:15193030-Ditylum_brightwellii.AAC.1
MSNLTFLEKFNALVTVVKKHGGNLAIHPSLVTADMPNTDGMSEEELAEWQEMLEEKFLACYFMKKICRVRYERLIDELHNDYLLRRCSYPMTVASAYDLINGYQDRSRHRAIGNTTNGVLYFSTVGTEKEDSDKEVVFHANGGKSRENIKCHQCHKFGHFTNQCPTDQEVTQGTTMVTVAETEDFNFATHCKIIINKINDESTVSTNGMPALLTRGE